MRDIGPIIFTVACTLLAGMGTPTSAVASIIVALLTYIALRLMDIQVELMALNSKK